MTRLSWDSSQICVTHSLVVTRKPYYPQEVRGQRAEGVGRGAVEALGSQIFSWNSWHKAGLQKIATIFLSLPVASPTQALSVFGVPACRPGPEASYIVPVWWWPWFSLPSNPTILTAAC